MNQVSSREFGLAETMPDHGLLATEVDALRSRLLLNASKTAQLCGISVRQLNYWSDRGLLPKGEGRQYGIAAVEKAILIKRTLARGYTLRRAARLVEEQLAVAAAERAGREALPVATLRAKLDERLDQLVAAVQRARESLRAAYAGGRETNGSASRPSLEAAAAALRLNRAIDELAAALEGLEVRTGALAAAP